MERKEQGLARYVVAVAVVVVPLAVVVAQQVQRRYVEGVQRYVEAAGKREARQAVVGERQGERRGRRQVELARSAAAE